jgi:hypothetical protein
MKQTQEKSKDKIIPQFHLTCLKKFINPTLSTNNSKEIKKEAQQIVDLLLAVSRKDEKALKTTKDTKAAPNIINGDIKLAKESSAQKPETTPKSTNEKGADDMLKPFLYRYVIDAIDLEMLSLYLRAVVSPELKAAIEALLKAEHEKEYQEFTMAMSIEAAEHYRDLYTAHHGMSANDEEIKAFETLLLAIPQLTIDGLVVLAEKIEEEIEIEHEKSEIENNTINENDKTEIEKKDPSQELTPKVQNISAPPPPKVEQINIHDMLRQTFHKLDSNHRKNFQKELHNVFGNHLPGDPALGRALYKICKDFDKLAIQKSQSHSNIKRSNRAMQR